MNTNQKSNFTEDIFGIQDRKINLVVALKSIKRYLTLFWQCSSLDLIFRKRNFWELVTSLEKHILVKISCAKISYHIYNIYNKYFRNDRQSVFRERERERERESKVETTIVATFLINIILIVFCINIQPSCCKTIMEYFNIKIWLLIKET